MTKRLLRLITVYVSHFQYTQVILILRLRARLLIQSPARFLLIELNSIDSNRVTRQSH